MAINFTSPILMNGFYTTEFAKELLLKHFGTASLKGFGINELENGVIAAGIALYYLSETQHDKVQHICKIARIEEDHYVWLDKFTVRNLELLHSPNDNAKTLLIVLDHTISPMGSRLLRRWIILPLKDQLPVDERLDIVEFLSTNKEFSLKLEQHNLKLIGDLERLISKVAVSRVNPREVVTIRRALHALHSIKSSLSECH